MGRSVVFSGLAIAPALATTPRLAAVCITRDEGYRGALLPRAPPDGVYGHRYSKSMDQPGKVASPVRGQVNRENEHNISLSAFTLENLVSRDGSAVPSRVSLLISILGLNLVLTYRIPPDFRDGVHV